MTRAFLFGLILAALVTPAAAQLAGYGPSYSPAVPGTSAGTFAAGNDPRFPANVFGIRKGLGPAAQDTAAGPADVAALLGTFTGDTTCSFVVNGYRCKTTGINGTPYPANGLIKSVSGAPTAAVPGTDFLTPTGSGSGLTGLTAAQVVAPGAIVPTMLAPGILNQALSCPAIESYGGGTAVADNTTAWNAFTAQISAGYKCVSFGSGTYNFASSIALPVAANQHVSVLGAGLDNTTLSWASTSGLTINEAAISSSFSIEKLTMASGGKGGSTVGLNVNGASNLSFNSMSNISDVLLRGADGIGQSDYWGTGINLNTVMNVNFSGGGVVGASGFPGGVGVSIFGSGANASDYSAVINFNNYIVANNYTGMNFGAFWQGVNIVNTNIVGCNFGISQATDTNSDVLSGLQLANDQMACNSNDIVIRRAIDGLMITGSFIGSGAPNVNGINLLQAHNSTIQGNVFLGNGGIGFNEAGTVASTAVVFSGNYLTGFGNNVNLTSTSANADVLGNTVQNSSGTEIVNTGTGNVIRNNVGYNPVGASAVSPGASPYTYTASASPETLYLSASTSITQITQNGTSILPAATAANAPIAVPANPNDVIVITYTGTLTMKKMVN